MYAYPKMLLLTILLTLFVHAEKQFINKDALNLAHITLSETYCKSHKPSQKLCDSKKLSYIDYDDAQLPTFLQGIKQHIAPIVQNYKENDIKKSTLAVIKEIQEFNTEISGEWYNESTIDLFAITSETYTLSTSSEGYQGGAHGYYSLGFDNYQTQTNTKLALDDLFVPDYNQTLHAIASNHYKRLKGLTPNQPLTDDDWFDDNFILAKSFAITPEGLYFVYNQYEIKAYAYGITEFMLPYSQIQNLINPKGPLAFALHKNLSFHAAYKQKDKMSANQIIRSGNEKRK